MRHSTRQASIGFSILVTCAGPAALAQSKPKQIEGSGWTATTTLAPAVAVSDKDKYAAWTDASTGEIMYSSFDGTTWATPVVVGGSGWTAGTGAAPALTWDFQKTELWLAWEGNGPNGDIWVSSNSGGTSSWSTQQVVSGGSWTAETSAAPALGLSFPSGGGSEIFLGWLGQSGSDLWYSDWNYTDWSTQDTVHGSGWTAGSSTGPGIDSGIYGPVMFWKGTGTHLWASFGVPWSTEQEITCSSPAYTANTDQSPAGIELVNGLQTIPVIDVAFWKNSSDNSIYYSDTLGPSGLCTFSVPAQVSGSGWSASTNVAPAAASAQALGGSANTILAWTNASDNTIWYIDPTTLSGLSAY